MLRLYPCKQETETSEHFNAVYPAFKETRGALVREHPADLPLEDPSKLTIAVLIILLFSILNNSINQPPVDELEFWSRRFCYQLHASRCALIAQLPPRVRDGL